MAKLKNKLNYLFAFIASFFGSSTLIAQESDAGDGDGSAKEQPKSAGDDATAAGSASGSLSAGAIAAMAAAAATAAAIAPALREPDAAS